jgi:cytidyltransferase-like protein
MKTATKVLKYTSDLQLASDHQKIVLVGGCFDILHFGHLQFLKAAKKEGEVLIVALESDEFIEKRKNRKPVHTQDQRAELLAEIGIVDFVIMLPYLKSDDEYTEMVRRVAPSVIAVTAGDPQIKNKKSQARVAVVTPVIKNFSTTKILKDIS